MSEGINLLPQEVRALEKKNLYVKYARFAGMGFLGLSVIISAVLFYLALNSSAHLAAVTKDKTDTEQALAAAKEAEVAAGVVSAKSKELNRLLKSRPLYSKLLEGLAHKTPTDAIITEINVLAPDKISISGTSLGYLSLAKFLKAVNNDPDSIFQNAVLNSVVLNNQSGSVQFSMELGIKSGSLAQ